MDVLEHANDRSPLFEQHSEGPRDLVGRCDLLGRAEKRSQRFCRHRIGGQGVQLFEHLDDRPVGDPLAVGEAAPAHRCCIHARKELGREPRLAHAGISDHGHELAARLHSRPFPRLPEKVELVRPTYERALVPALDLPGHR